MIDGGEHSIIARVVPLDVIIPPFGVSGGFPLLLTYFAGSATSRLHQKLGITALLQ